MVTKNGRIKRTILSEYDGVRPSGLIAVLLDLALPGIDGWEATRLLKAEPDTSHLLIVALSAHALAAEGERARAAGCDGFIAKPCLPSDLVQEIGHYLKGQPASRERRPRSRRH